MDIETEQGVPSPALEDSQISDKVTSDYSIMGLIATVHELYYSDDIEVRLCWWLVYCLVALWVCIIMAWKMYGLEIMAVLTYQDKLVKTGPSSSQGSSRQSSAEETPTEPSKPPQENQQLPGRPVESSVSEPNRPKVD